MEAHEGRLAEALELDRVSRVLEFRERPISPQRPATNDNGTEAELKTIWTGTEWVTRRQSQSRSFQCGSLIHVIELLSKL
jgi:hypothetical protein